MRSLLYITKISLSFQAVKPTDGGFASLTPQPSAATKCLTECLGELVLNHINDPILLLLFRSSSTYCAEDGRNYFV